MEILEHITNIPVFSISDKMGSLLALVVVVVVVPYSFKSFKPLR
jgi:hypothetical protein